jgi:hypothetical protein
MLRRSREREARTSAVPDTCEHLDIAIDAAEPDLRTPGHCEDRIQDGKDAWAHLRMCLTHQHTSGDFAQSGHPVLRSIEPGANWRWCYIGARVG